MNSPQSKSRASKIGEAYILAAYTWLLDLQQQPDFEGVTGERMREHLSCSKSMVLGSQCVRFNEVMRKYHKPHRFRVTPGNKSRFAAPAKWSLRDYSPVDNVRLVDPAD